MSILKRLSKWIPFGQSSRPTAKDEVLSSLNPRTLARVEKKKRPKPSIALVRSRFLQGSELFQLASSSRLLPASPFKVDRTATNFTVLNQEFAKLIRKELSELQIVVNSSESPKFVYVEQLTFGDNSFQSEVGVRFRLSDDRQSMPESIIDDNQSSAQPVQRKTLGPNNSVLEERFFDFTFHDPEHLKDECDLLQQFVVSRLRAT